MNRSTTTSTRTVIVYCPFSEMTPNPSKISLKVRVRTVLENTTPNIIISRTVSYRYGSRTYRRTTYGIFFNFFSER